MIIVKKETNYNQMTTFQWTISTNTNAEMEKRNARKSGHDFY